MSGATPGPWKVYRSPDGSAIIGIGVNRPGDPDHGAGITDPRFGLWGSGAEREANARLIAAAPDLLAALKHLLAFVEAHTEAGEVIPPYTVEHVRARAAIAKAERGAE